MAENVMSKDASRAIGSGRAPLDVHLRRYERSYRRRLRKLAKSSARLGDLVHSFPAAAFTLATAHGNPLGCREALALVEKGADLRSVGNSLKLPGWTRRLEPEVLSEALQKVPGGTPEFDRRIVNLIPSDLVLAKVWLSWIIRANALAGEEFALWLARQSIWKHAANDGYSSDGSSLVALAAFAWFSGAPGTTARGFIREPFAPNMRFWKAVEAARDWFVRLMLEHCMEQRPAVGRWFVEQRVSGLRVVPLRTERELVKEGERMNNCVASYYGKVARGECLIYGIRRGNEYLATMEIGPRWQAAGSAVIAQLLGPENAPVDAVVLRAAQVWLGRQGNYPFIPGGAFDRMPISEWRWQELWAPYREAFQPAALTSGREVGRQALLLFRSLESLTQLAAASR